MKKKNRPSFLFLIAASFLSCYFLPTSSIAAEIALLKSKNLKPYDIAIKGLKKQVRANIVEHDMKADLQKGLSMVNKIKAKKPEIVLALGGEASFVASNHISQFPVVFSMVSDPVRYRIKGANVTGVQLDIPLVKNVEVIHKVMPTIKKLGVIYSNPRSESLLNETRPSLSNYGIELITVRIGSLKEIPSAVKRLIQSIDALWLIYDPLVTSSPRITRDAIILPALKNKIPVVGFNKWSVTAGSLFCLYSEYMDVGVQTGNMINRILEGTPPSSIPIESPEIAHLFFNDKAIERIRSKVKLNIPDKAFVWKGK